MRREHDDGGRAGRRDDVAAVLVHRLFDHAQAKIPQVGREPVTGVAFAPRRGIDIDEPSRQLNGVDASANYLIHASSSVRVSVRESRYFTITGVASDRPHSRPFPTVTARAPGTTTAPSGMTSGCSAIGLITSPRTKS